MITILFILTPGFIVKGCRISTALYRRVVREASLWSGLELWPCFPLVRPIYVFTVWSQIFVLNASRKYYTTQNVKLYDLAWSIILELAFTAFSTKLDLYNPLDLHTDRWRSEMQYEKQICSLKNLSTLISVNEACELQSHTSHTYCKGSSTRSNVWWTFNKYFTLTRLLKRTEQVLHSHTLWSTSYKDAETFSTLQSQNKIRMSWSSHGTSPGLNI